MKNKILPFLFGGALFGFYWFRGKKDLINQLQIDLTKVKLNREKTRSALFFSLFFDISLKLTNPTKSAIKINHIFIEIFAGDKKIGQAIKSEDFNISVNSESNINFTAKISVLNSLSELIDLLKGGDTPIFSGRGYVETSAGRVTFDKKFN